MSLAQRGLYIDMLAEQASEGGCPADAETLRQLFAPTMSADDFSKVWTKPLTECWKARNGQLVNGKLDDVLKASWDRVQGYRRAGQTGASARWSDATAMRSHTDRTAVASKSQSDRSAVAKRSQYDGNGSNRRVKAKDQKKDQDLSSPTSKEAKQDELVDIKQPTGPVPEEIRAGITWDKAKAEVVFSSEARQWLKEHMKELADDEQLRLLTPAQMQASWGFLNAHLVIHTMKRGPKTLPTLSVKWFENEMRKRSGPDPTRKQSRARAALEDRVRDRK